jgi:hypothetical protein
MLQNAADVCNEVTLIYTFGRTELWWVKINLSAATEMQVGI